MGSVMSVTLEAWLIRHAESVANTGVWSDRPQEVGLSEQGFKQAAEIAQKVIVQPDLIVVSPFKRSQQTAAPLIARWPQAPVEVWPVEELIYLAPSKCFKATVEERRSMVESYWQRADPFFGDGEGAETFAHFVSRLQT